MAGGPGNVSCTNSIYTPGVSMHVFPKNEKARNLWVRFVRRHRDGFVLTPASALCSVHFEACRRPIQTNEREEDS